MTIVNAAFNRCGSDIWHDLESDPVKLEFQSLYWSLCQVAPQATIRLTLTYETFEVCYFDLRAWVLDESDYALA